MRKVKLLGYCNIRGYIVSVEENNECKIISFNDEGKHELIKFNIPERKDEK